MYSSLLFATFFLTHRVSFQTGIDFDSKKEFWASFGNSLRDDNSNVDLPPIASADDFRMLFHKWNSPMFSNQPVVLFIDEFDKLNRAPDEVVDSVLDVLRGMRQRREAYCLQVYPQIPFVSSHSQSVVTIGPFSILQLTGRSSSPFNVRKAVQAPYFTLEEVKDLFSIYEEKKGFELDQRIVEDIFVRTAGYVLFFIGYSSNSAMQAWSLSVVRLMTKPFARIDLPSHMRSGFNLHQTHPHAPED